MKFFENNWSPAKKILYLLGFLLFSMMIVTPSAYQVGKSLLLLVLFAGIFADLWTNRHRRMTRSIFNFFIFYIILGLIYGLYGWINGNAGAGAITKEVVLYVIFYMILINGVHDYDSLKFINRILIFSTAFLCLYLILSVLNAYGAWPNWLYYNLETETSDRAINTDAIEAYGRLSVSFSSFPNLLFIQPYLFSQLMLDPQSRTKSMWLIYVTMSVIMIFVGRRILLIVSILSPIIITIILQKTKWRKAFSIKPTTILFIFSIVIIAIIIIIKISGMSIQSIIDYLFLTFKTEQVSPEGILYPNVRIEQVEQLFKGWKESPIFGFGSGAFYAPYLRSETEPWNYEVLYMQFLYSWGIVGCGLYGVGIIYIIKKLWMIFKKNIIYSNFAFSILMGMVAFLIGTATNPYLLKFDVLYIIFLPVAVINLYLKSKKNVVSKHC